MIWGIDGVWISIVDTELIVVVMSAVLLWRKGINIIMPDDGEKGIKVIKVISYFAYQGVL